MNRFWVMDNLNGPDGGLTAQAISVAEDKITPNPIQLRWMINPCILGMPTSAFTVAVKRVPRPSDPSKKTAIANDEVGWKNIEFVGLPLDGIEGCSQYNSGPQGPVPEPGGELDFPSLRPSEAAIRRLELGAPIRGWESLPGAVPNPMSDIEWRTPSPKDYVDELLRSPLINGICQLLNKDLSPAKACEFEVTLAEKDTPHLTMDVTMENPDFAEMRDRNKSGRWRPLGIMLLAAASDPLAALALGFGTAVPFELSDMAFRISGEFNLPDLGTVQVADVVWVEDASLRPELVKNLRASLTSFNPPKRVDGVSVESIAIQWDRPLIPTHTTAHSAPYPASYAIAKFGKGGENPRILLTPRSGINGWLPYIATKTGDNHPIVFNDHVNRETFPNTPDPFGRATSYLVSAQDIFGRWSDWETTVYQSDAESAQIPAVLGVKIQLRDQRNEELPDGAPLATHDQLTVDFSWDWTLRSPQFIELSGMYVDDPSSEVFNVHLKFAGADRPNPLPNNVIPLRQNQEQAVDWGGTQDADPSVIESTVRYYRLSMELDIDFANREERAFQVQARGQCALHERNLAGFNISPLGPPVTTILKNPRPPDAPELFMPEPLEAPLWATLSDTAGTSRIVLRWAATPRAKGYFLYEATESSLVAGTDTSQPVTKRLAALRALPLQSKRFSFQRVNREPILAQGGQVSHEVTLPRGSRVIHLYAVTAKTENQIESEFPASSQNYFAVAAPRLGVPSPPTLEVNAMPDAFPPHVELKLRGGPGVKTSRFEIYRTRREELAKRLDKMGPPAPFDDATGEEATLHDELAPGWERVWYRAVAWSADDPLQGIVAARSLPSPAVSVLLPPTAPPEIFDVRVNEPGSTETEALVSWKSDVPLALSPLGYHEAVVQGQSAVGAIAIHQRLDQIKTVSSSVGLPSMPPAGEIVCLKEGNSFRFLARVPRVASEASFNITLKMIDPLGRIGTKPVDVPQLALMHLPQLSAIAFSWMRPVPFPVVLQEGVKAQWEILSPIFQGALQSYTLFVSLERAVQETGTGIIFLSLPEEHTFTLAQLFGPAPQVIQHTPGTQQFSIPIDLNVFSISVTLTDPLGRTATETASVVLKELPDLNGMLLAKADQKLSELGLISVPSMDIIILDFATAVVDFLEPPPGTRVPVGAHIVVHPRDAPQVSVPDVIGLDFRTAEIRIRDAELIPQEGGFTFPGVAEGIVAQIDPFPGTLAPVGSVVIYFVGNGL